MAATVLGIDIGGANLKAADTARRAVAVPFALWKQPDGLSAALAGLIAQFPDCDTLAVTMTGELCDCFRTKAEGVSAIVHAVQGAARGRQIRVWGTDDRFRTPAEATANYMAVAAANWHALATFAGCYAPRGVALLIDVGTTTTDIIPMLDGVPWTRGKTDPDRMRYGELVYLGAKRTPATTLLGPGAAAEFFATMHDAFLLLNMVPEDPADCDTADGRPATRANAHARLSRMVGGDPVITSPDVTLSLARRMVERHAKHLADAVAGHKTYLREMREAAIHPKRTAILSGSGEFVARTMLGAAAEFDEILSLADRLGPELSACGPAYAVAVLAGERP